MRLHLVSTKRWHSLHAVHVFTLMHDEARETGRFSSAVFGEDIELRLKDR